MRGGGGVRGARRRRDRPGGGRGAGARRSSRITCSASVPVPATAGRPARRPRAASRASPESSSPRRTKTPPARLLRRRRRALGLPARTSDSSAAWSSGAYDVACSFRITRSTARPFMRQYSWARRSWRTISWSSTSSMRTSTIGQVAGDAVRPERRRPEPVALRASRRARAASGPSRGSGSRAAGRGGPRRLEMPRWRSWTCACVQARLATRSNVAGSRYLSASVERRLARVGDDQVANVHARRRARGQPHAAPQAEDRVEHRRRPCSRAGGRPSIDARVPDARGRGRGTAPRSVSYCTRADASRPRPPRRAPPRPAPPRSRGRRLRQQRLERRRRTRSATKRFEKAGCAASAAGGREHDLGVGGELDLARPRARGWSARPAAPRRRPRARPAISSVVAIGPSRRRISARSSE